MKPNQLVALLLLLAVLLFPSIVSAQTGQEADDIFKQGQGLYNRAQNRADVEKALALFEKALAINRKLGRIEQQSWNLNDIGLVYRSWGDYPKALDYFDKALQIHGRTGNLKEEAVTLHNAAQVYNDWGQYQKALEMFEKALAINRKLGRIEQQGWNLNDIGLVYRSRGDYPKSLDYFDKALQIYRRAGNLKEEGVTLHNAAQVYYDWGQYEKALGLFEKALAINKKLGRTQQQGHNLNDIGLIYRSWGDYPKALDYFDKALQIYDKSGNLKEEAVTVHNAAQAHNDWGQYEKALGMFEKALAINRKLGRTQQQGHNLNDIGLVYRKWGDYPKALDYFGKAREIFVTAGNLKEEAITLHNTAQAHNDWGQYQKALEIFEKSLAINRKLGRTQEQGQNLNDIGLVYRSWGNYPKALDYFDKARELFRGAGNLKEEAITLNNVADLRAQWGEYDKALADRQRALDIQKKIGVPTKGTLDQIGNLYLDMGRTALAEPVIKEAGYLSSLGRLALINADYGNAKQYYEQLVEWGQKTGQVDSLFIGYTGAGEACERLKDYEKAAEYYEKGVKLVEEIRTGLSPSEREAFFSVRVGGFDRTAPYKGLVRVLIELKRPLEALKHSEYTKARAFSEALSSWSQTKGLDVPPDVLKKDLALSNRLVAVRKARAAALEKGNRHAVEALESQIRTLEGEQRDHVKMLRERYPLFAATRYPQPMALDQTALKENEWAILYDVTDPGLVVYLTKGNHLVKTVYKPIARAELIKLVRAFREPVESIPGKDNLVEMLSSYNFAAGKKLYDILVGDVSTDLPADVPLLVVPDDSLGVLPFEMLVMNDGGEIKTDSEMPRASGAQFFGDRNPTSYCQSITALTLARTLGKQQKAGEKMLAMVDPVFSLDDPRLAKYAAQEKEKLLASLPKAVLMSIQTENQLSFPRLPLTGQLGESLKTADPSGIELYEGLAARKSVILEKDLTAYRAVVFATHGYFGKDLPSIQEPVLVLSLLDQPKDRDGFLRLSEVMGLKLNCDIAALTACQTGLGKHISGEGTMGMGRAFQYAGARSVLMSLWSVAEKSSVDLVESFFKHLKAGKNKLEALKLARDEIRKAGYDHPFFWAPFILVGEVD